MLLQNGFTMKRKITLLIIGCIATVAALTAIQGYFIYNTYKLTSKEASEAIHKQLLRLEEMPEYDSLNKAWMATTEKFIKNYKKSKVAKPDYGKVIGRQRDSLSNNISELLKTAGLPAYIGYNTYITSVVINEETNDDTIYKGRALLFGNRLKNDIETGFSQGRWQSRSIEKVNTDNDSEIQQFDYEIKTGRYYSVENLERLILGKMAGLLAFSVALLCFVVALFYLSLKNLIRQKNIADIQSDFINNITHEFQTPLATLNVAITTMQLKERELSPEQYYNTITIIERQNSRLQKLFKQVTDASLATDAMPPAEKQLYGCKEAQQVIADFKISRPEAKITCTGNDGSFITMDRFHFNTILVNLLDNALKYGADTVTINISQDETSFIMKVSDNGHGIAVKEQALIFDKFYRVEKGNSHNTKGLGLGLYYIKQLINAHKGKITVESRLNEGSTFTIILPQS